MAKAEAGTVSAAAIAAYSLAWRGSPVVPFLRPSHDERGRAPGKLGVRSRTELARLLVLRADQVAAGVELGGFPRFTRIARSLASAQVARRSPGQEEKKR
jgi:hypothetical protein